MAAGDYELLETFGIHQTETDKTKEAFSAVTFIDSIWWKPKCTARGLICG